MTAEVAPSAIRVPRAGAQTLDRIEIVAHEQHRAALTRHGVHFSEAFLLKFRVPDGQYLVHDEHLRLEVRRNREGQPQIHTAGVPFDRSVQKGFDSGELNDFVEPLTDIGAIHA